MISGPSLVGPAGSHDHFVADVGSMTSPVYIIVIIMVIHLAVYIVVAGDLHLNFSLRRMKGDTASFNVRNPLSDCIVISRCCWGVSFANKMVAFRSLKVKNKLVS